LKNRGLGDPHRGEPNRRLTPDSDPTRGIRINVFLWRTRRNTNSVFRLVNPVYDMNTYIFKVAVFTKQAKSE